MDELNEEFKKDLLRFMSEYKWEPRITTKILKFRYGNSYAADEIKTMYGKRHPQEPDPIDHLLNLEGRRSPILPDDEEWLWPDPTIFI